MLSSPRIASLEVPEKGFGEEANNVRAVAKEYRKASKKEKGAILDRFMEATNYQRRYGPDCYGIK